MPPTPSAPKRKTNFSRTRAWIALAVATLVLGYFWWLPAYSELDLSSLFLPFAVTSFLIAAIVAVRDYRESLLYAAFVGSAGPTAVMIRVVVEVIQDSTSHNLWPFELVIAVLMTLPAALVGGFLGSWLRRLK